jgi:hypothetical protein
MGVSENGRGIASRLTASANTGASARRKCLPGYSATATAARLVDLLITIKLDAEKTIRAIHGETMARRRFQQGSLFKRGTRRKVWVARWWEDIVEAGGTLKRQRRSEVIGR